MWNYNIWDSGFKIGFESLPTSEPGLESGFRMPSSDYNEVESQGFRSKNILNFEFNENWRKTC